MEANQPEAERPKPEPGALHCPAAPEEGAAPRTRGAPVAQTQVSPEVQLNRTKALGELNTTEAGMGWTAERLTDLISPRHKIIMLVMKHPFK